MEALETFLADRKAMSQHQERMPTTRVTMWIVFHVKQERFELWECEDKVPPSTAPELEPSSSPDRPRDGRPPQSHATAACPEQSQLPGLVMEVSADGTVITWPGPEVL